MLAVLGGSQDGRTGSEDNREAKAATIKEDILLFDPGTGCWKTSLKQHMRTRPRCRLAEIIQVGELVYLVWQPLPPTNEPEHSRGMMRVLLETEGSDAVIEKIDLASAISNGRVMKEVASALPTPLHSGLISSCVLGNSLFLLASRPSGQPGPMWSFNTSLATWREHPSPIGNVGEGKPMLAAFPPLLVLVGAKPAADAGPTNCLQTYDPGVGEGCQLGRYPSKSESPPSSGKAEGHLLEPSGGTGGNLIGTWRRLQDLNTRLTPIHLVNHCGSLYLVGWQPARQNFILKLNLQGEKVDCEEVLNGLEGVWSQGVLLREALMDKL